jgi:hypothetical protein
MDESAGRLGDKDRGICTWESQMSAEASSAQGIQDPIGLSSLVPGTGIRRWMTVGRVEALTEWAKRMAIFY